MKDDEWFYNILIKKNNYHINKYFKAYGCILRLHGSFGKWRCTRGACIGGKMEIFFNRRGRITNG